MAQPTYRTHHGMHDILPGEVEKWQALETMIRTAARTFHFSEIRTPILEMTELISRGVGQDTDIVSKEIFSFDRGDDHYVLRPECTAPVARAYTEHHMDQWGGTRKLFYIGPMFRAERPQKGRQRQFHQFGVEILGSDDPMADLETISFMVHLIETLGIPRTTLRLNSIGDPEDRQRYLSALEAWLEPRKADLSEISRDRLGRNALRILDSKEEEDQPLIAEAPRITEYLGEEAKNHFVRLCSYLDLAGIKYELDPLLVRGLDYYSRTAFELTSPDLGSQDALAGGGRYDRLIEDVGGPSTPAVGFAAGMERLLIACEELGIELGKPARPDLYLVTLGEEARSWAVSALKKLRNAGLSVTTDYSVRSMKAQMKDANRENARFTLIVGSEELKENRFTLRNMQESEEQSLSLEEIAGKIRSTSVPT
ncbi:MAG: histidine--tRNA ligase [Balneolaceae bacterium]